MAALRNDSVRNGMTHRATVILCVSATSVSAGITVFFKFREELRQFVAGNIQRLTDIQK